MIQTNINIPYAMKYALVSAEDKPFTVAKLALVLLEEVEGFIDEKKPNHMYMRIIEDCN
ncbi:hypothetical protein OQE50_26600 (plasmid) [Enterobacter kobei]|uniref:hypothetical protein n=1 Tax=Enterobacter kobei TaxID=208224 RepID=UPI00224A9475|nr:hypothetical protein [Enterobacter kobei]UZQ70537.1 hypothetical protein OQE50_26600 [Enterobacter kobei]